MVVRGVGGWKRVLLDSQPWNMRNMLHAPTPLYKSELTDRRVLLSQGSKNSQSPRQIASYTLPFP